MSGENSFNLLGFFEAKSEDVFLLLMFEMRSYGRNFQKGGIFKWGGIFSICLMCHKPFVRRLVRSTFYTADAFIAAINCFVLFCLKWSKSFIYDVKLFSKWNIKVLMTQKEFLISFTKH